MSSYRVDTQAADRWVERLQKRLKQSERVVTGVGDYAAIYDLGQGQGLAASCDGVGTKLLWTLEGWGTPHDLAQDLVAMNTNDLICVGAKPALFLDYLAVSQKSLLEPGAILDSFMSGLVDACDRVGCWLVGGETAQLPDLYKPGHFDLAGFAIGFLKLSERLSVERVKPGQQLWALASSGPHSNGFTLLRELFDPVKDSDALKTLMAPTGLYPALGGIPGVEAAFHITGSGLLNLLRSQPTHRTVGFELNWNPGKWPDWARECVHRGKLSKEAAYGTFNMGLGLIVSVSDPTEFLRHCEKHGWSPQDLGRVIEDPVVRVDGIELR